MIKGAWVPGGPCTGQPCPRNTVTGPHGSEKSAVIVGLFVSAASISLTDTRKSIRTMEFYAVQLSWRQFYEYY